jgi:hypothetical protein
MCRPLSPQAYLRTHFFQNLSLCIAGTKQVTPNETRTSQVIRLSREQTPYDCRFTPGEEVSNYDGTDLCHGARRVSSQTNREFFSDFFWTHPKIGLPVEGICRLQLLILPRCGRFEPLIKFLLFRADFHFSWFLCSSLCHASVPPSFFIGEESLCALSSSFI